MYRLPSAGEADVICARAEAIRLRSVEMIASQGLGYLGQALSSAELVATLFAAYRPGQDTFVCSPGHYIIAVYACAMETGLIEPSLASTYGCNGSDLEAIGTEKARVVDYVCGSLGQGLSAAVGFAMADKLGARDAAVYALVSDGEMEEGQLWEAAMFASHHGLNNLVVFLDANNSQVDGQVTSVTTIEPIADKWRAFGWNTVEVDGHDVNAVINGLHEVTGKGRPSVLIGRTSTVHGISSLKDVTDGHFIKIDSEGAQKASDEIKARLANLRYRGPETAFVATS
jgi:transketolase